MAKRELSVFLIKEQYKDFDTVIESDLVYKVYQLKEYPDFEGTIFLGPNPGRIPDWLEWLQQSIDDNIDHVFNSSTRAVLLIRRKGIIFAFAFGHGQHMLVKQAIVRDFGVRVVLNGVEHDGLRSADTMEVADITVHQRTQTSRNASIRGFNIDVESVLLKKLTGKSKYEKLGTMLTGRDSLFLSVDIEFKDLGELCDILIDLYNSEDYKEHFWWFDNIQRVSDIILLDELDQQLYYVLLQAKHDEFHLAPPQIIDYEALDGFSFTKKGQTQQEMCAESYVTFFNARERNPEFIKRSNIYARKDGDIAYKWRAYDCFVFEVHMDHGNYILSGGSWYKVQETFVDYVDTYVEHQIPDADIVLPDCYKGEIERDYNIRVAKERGYLCLDRRNVFLRGNQIEVCDLLTNKNQFIHIKHWSSSSTLSHLFSQARVSAETLQNDRDFRERVSKLIGKCAPAFNTIIDHSDINPDDFQIIYAIIFPGDKPIHQRLPFFSKLNMMNHAKGLKVLGFKVFKARIPLVDTVQVAVLT